MHLVKKIPLPMAGLILGMLALGNLLLSYGAGIRLVVGALAAILYGLYIGKMMTGTAQVLKDLENPVVASVFPTFSMATMLLAAYLFPYASALATLLWWIGVLLHIGLILWFTMKFVLKKDLKLVFPSWFVVFVGIVVASVTGPLFKATAVAQGSFWFGLFSYLVLIPLVCYRLQKLKLPEPAFPTIMILTAPGGLLLAGYMNAFADKSQPLVYFLLAVSLAFYLFTLLQLPKVLQLPFYPSIGAITFPTVITALGFKLTHGYLVKSGNSIAGMGYLVKFMEVVAVVCVLIALFRYMQFLIKKNEVGKK